MPKLYCKQYSSTATLYSEYEPSPQMLRRLNGLKKSNSLLWELTDFQLYYIKTHYPNYKVTPLVYIIKIDKNLESPQNAPSIIKKIHKGAQRGKTFIRSSLKKNEIDLLNQIGIFYKPVKFLITL